MYISRVVLDAGDGRVRHLALSPYRIHALVESACGRGAGAPSEGGRNLWRLDVGREGAPKLYIVSPAAPDAELILGETDSAVETKSYETRLDALAGGQRWAFRLKANPARKVLVDKGGDPNSKVIGSIRGHVTMEQQVEWLVSRSERFGFKVPDGQWGQPQLIVSQRRKERFKRGESTITIATAFYDGVLEVTDVGLLRTALCGGIGRAKGFGCGLLTIADLRQGSGE